MLVFLIGIDNVLHQRLLGAVDDPPQAVALGLGLFLFEEAHLHVHEVDLFEEVFDVFVLDVEVGVEAHEGVVLLGQAV